MGRPERQRYPGRRRTGYSRRAQVILKGTDNQGNPVTLITSTDNTGMYMFGDLVPGTYQITFGTPGGYEPTPFDQGNNDSMDSDAGPMGYDTGIHSGKRRHDSNFRRGLLPACGDR
ncbi:MAG: hypothetical protein IPK76_03850 [Lewinellaceae bacterium]|nr:hypothetical protein [Lewinellaceae bacterium]